MRFAAYRDGGRDGLAASLGGAFHGLPSDHARYPGSLSSLVASGTEGLLEAGRALLSGPEVDLGSVTLVPPLPSPPKIVCVGLNYADRSAESGFKAPDYPTIFGRHHRHRHPVRRRLGAQAPALDEGRRRPRGRA